jgi:SAM-dependent methyltransferase
LRCECSEFPILGGIPTFRRDRLDTMKQTSDAAIHRGPDVRLLLSKIRAGEADGALLLLLVPPDRAVRKTRRAGEVFPGRFGRRLTRRAYRAWERIGEERRDLFLGDATRSSTEDLLEYYGSNWFVHWDFFLHRFGMPRQLTSLGLASTLLELEKPVLDLACGMGHTLHYWTTRRPDHLFVGVDRNFFQLYASRRWVAPRAEYVCSDADVPLPFRSDAFGAAFCMDAFHLFRGRLTAVTEMERITGEDGVVQIVRAGNALVKPHEGLELSPAGYLRLFAAGRETRFAPEEMLLDRYLHGLGPALASPAGPEDVAKDKWISIVSSRRREVFRDYGAFGQWPHGLGRLAINPLYVERGRTASGEVELELVLPTEWYEFENADCRRYMPPRVTMTAADLDDIAAGRRTPRVEQWIGTSVVIGVPERYLRTTGVRPPARSPAAAAL